MNEPDAQQPEPTPADNRALALAELLAELDELRANALREWIREQKLAEFDGPTVRVKPPPDQ